MRNDRANKRGPAPRAAAARKAAPPANRVSPKRSVAKPGFEDRVTALEEAFRALGAVLLLTPPGPGDFDERAHTLGAKLLKLGA